MPTNNRRCSLHLLFFASVFIATGVSSVSEAADRIKPTIKISMTPSHVVLGEHETADVFVNVSAQGGPIQCETIRIHSNTGELSPLENIGDGRYKSTLDMPDDFFPRFALVAAVGTCNGVPAEGHTVIPLYGTGEVEVKAKPFSEVTLKIADQTFGPKRTNERGKTSIPIVVSPGHSVGIVGNKTVDLKLPQVNRVVAIANRTEIMAGDKGRTIIWIFAINQKGDPLEDGHISISTNKGHTTAAQYISAGVYKTYYTGPTVIGDKKGAIQLSIKGDPTSKDTIAFDFKPGKPANVQIRTAAPFFRAGETETVHVSVAVVDQYGNPTGDPVTLESDFGSLTPLVRNDQGTYNSVLTVPNFFEGRQSLLLFATGNGERRPFVAEQHFPLKAGSPTKINILQPSKPIPADGRTPYLITIEVLDEFGNPVVGAPLFLTASKGTIPNTVTTTRKTKVPYTPPLGPGSDKCRLEASVLDISEKATVSLTDRTYLLAATVRAGYINNLANLSTFHWSVSLEQNIWFIVSGLYLSVDIGHHFSSDHLKEEAIKSNFHGFSLHGMLGYRKRFLPVLYLSASAGVGTHIILNRTIFNNNTVISESAAQFSYQFAAELGYWLGPGHVVVQVGFGVSEPSRINGLEGNTSGMTIMIGYRMPFV